MKRGIWSFCCLLLLVAVGCSPSQPPVLNRAVQPKEQVSLSAELKNLYREVALESGVVDALDGYADLYITTPRRNAKVYCNVQVQRAKDAHLIMTAGILGWPVADMLIRRDSLFVHDMLKNRMFVGKNSEENLEKIIGVQSGFGQLTESLLGLASMSEPAAAIESVRKGEGKISYSVRSEAGIKEFLVDPVSKTLDGLALYDVDGRKAVEFIFGNFEILKIHERQVRIPREIDMIVYREEEAGNEEYRMRVVYDERAVNPSAFAIRFRKPSKARMINLEEVERFSWL